MSAVRDIIFLQLEKFFNRNLKIPLTAPANPSLQLQPDRAKCFFFLLGRCVIIEKNFFWRQK
ncbi:MAG: hypothetical protein OP8BY_2194 [Candidatus Saccharicenans subterraneus]|uniref:Uncharacterized protein n=1 Tax=Candidatus Saccharicenans subterraneus TaxID=2508984 RepID=A0A3E2BMG0_9BACT|nr:MAG: hypothetical protein OP8BY_2194 [Candidatus Saccharicenans subterraneum]